MSVKTQEETRLTRASSKVFPRPPPSLLSTFTSTLIISTLICKVFAPVCVCFCKPRLFYPTWTPRSAGPQAAVYWLGWGSPWPVPPLHLGVPTGWNTAEHHPTAALRLFLFHLLPGRRCYCCCRRRCCCCSSGASARWGETLQTRSRPSLSDWCLEWPASWLFLRVTGPVQRSGSLPLPRRTRPGWWCSRARTCVEIEAQRQMIHG